VQRAEHQLPSLRSCVAGGLLRGVCVSELPHAGNPNMQAIPAINAAHSASRFGIL